MNPSVRGGGYPSGGYASRSALRTCFPLSAERSFSMGFRIILEPAPTDQPTEARATDPECDVTRPEGKQP